ncbi:MAG TPA: phospholipase D-like domain-containing protein, partial [Verrucomicrobiae bacterium]|nr:phospholipase D-like domain-containing protein [Verrucomicrobiae bacterium]
RRFNAKRAVSTPSEQILLSGPGRGQNPMKRALRHDLGKAENVQIVVGYFLPTWKMRRALARVARRGGKVQLILAGKTDVRVSQLAGQSLYRRLLKAGVEIYEYQPQILHAKLFILDDKVYVGSANLDQRSLNINYEMMLRFVNPVMAVHAREIFSSLRQHCRLITPEGWRRSRTFLTKLEQRLAYWLLVRVDPYVARKQWRALPK